MSICCRLMISPVARAVINPNLPLISFSTKRANWDPGGAIYTQMQWSYYTKEMDLKGARVSCGGSCDVPP